MSFGSTVIPRVAVLAGALASLGVAAQPTFTNVTAETGFVTAGNRLAGLATVDLDGDGCPEVITNADDGTDAGTRVLRTACNQLPSYNDVTSVIAPHFATQLAQRSVVVGDLNGDGWPDVVRTGFRSLYVDLNGGPTAVFPYALQSAPGFPFTSLSNNYEGVGLFDVEADGDLDIVAQFDGLEVWRNDGAGRFTRELVGLGLPQTPDVNGEYLSVADLDDDGDVDLVARLEEVPDVWINLGASFGPTLNLEPSNDNKGDVTLCDLDNDGFLDLVWTDAADVGENTVRWQRAPGVFVEGQRLFGGQARVGASACGDLDSDGWDDLVLVMEAQLDGGRPASGLTDLVLLNQRDGGFRATPTPGLGGGSAVAAVLFDADRDGDLDLAVHRQPADQLWRNDLPGQRALIVRAVEPQSGQPRDALGASAVLERCDGGRLSGRREVSGGTGRGTMPEPRMRFGLGTVSDDVAVVRVRFVGGSIIRRAVRLSTASLLTIARGEPSELSLCLPPLVDGGAADGGRSDGGTPDAGSEADAGGMTGGGAAGGASGGGTAPVVRTVQARCGLPLTAYFFDSLGPGTISARGGDVPAGLTFDGDDGALRWTPPAASGGTYRLALSRGGVTVPFEIVVACEPTDARVGCGCDQAAGGALLALLACWSALRSRRRS
ncbi:MAG: FG-GAP-like repeat-containing protein [Myxococcales bacterium]|nr:FG-GAP-like repeat-containing protein [Myxococcales bacterium]